MTSYLRYKQELRTVQDADDIESWITVRGNHIPIRKGQSKEDAVKSFLESKSEPKGLIEQYAKAHNKLNRQETLYQQGKTTEYQVNEARNKALELKGKVQKQEAGFRLLEIGYNDVDFGKDPAKNKQNVLNAIKESGTENADYLTNIVKNMPDNSFADIEKFRTGVKNAKKDFSEGSNISKSESKQESKKENNIIKGKYENGEAIRQELWDNGYIIDNEGSGDYGDSGMEYVWKDGTMYVIDIRKKTDGTVEAKQSSMGEVSRREFYEYLEEQHKDDYEDNDDDNNDDSDISDIESKEDAAMWLNKQIKKHGNTYFWNGSMKSALNKLTEKFGNTYFWNK